MKNNRRHFDPEEVYGVDLGFFPNIHLHDDAKIVFIKYIGDYLWVLFQDGLLVNKHYNCDKIVKYRIDFYDKETVQCFNLLPRIYGKKPDLDLRNTWRLKVYDPDVESERESSDILCMDDQGNLYLQGYRRAWYEFVKTRHSLDIEIERITRTLRERSE